MVTERKKRKRFDPRTPERAAESGVPFLGLPPGATVKAVPGGRPIITSFPSEFEIPPEFDVSPELRASRQVSPPAVTPPRPAITPLAPPLEEFDEEGFRGFEREPELTAALIFAQGEREKLLSRVFPERFQPGLPPFGFTDINRQIDEDPETFLRDLVSRGRTEDTESFLRLLNVSEPDIDEIFGQAALEARTLELIDRVFPGQTLEDVIEAVERDSDAFIKGLVLRGRTDDSESLLRIMGVEDVDILFRFGNIPSGGQPFFFERDVDGVPVRTMGSLKPDGIVKVEEDIVGLVNFNDGEFFSVKRLQRMEEIEDDAAMRQMGEEAGLSKEEIDDMIEFSKIDLDSGEFDDFIRKKDPTFFNKVIFAPITRSAMAGFGNTIRATGGAAAWAKQKQLSKNLIALGEAFAKGAPPMVPFTTLGDTVTNPMFWATSGTQMIVGSVSMMLPLMIATATALPVAGALGLGATATTVFTVVTGSSIGALGEAAIESGSAYNEAIDMGKSPEDASKIASSVYWQNAALLVGSNLLELGAMFTGNPTLVFERLVGRGLAKGVIVGGKIVGGGLTETGQELGQRMVTDRAFDREFKWDDDAKMISLLSFVTGGAFVGAGSLFVNIQERTRAKFTPEQQEAFNKKRREFIDQDFVPEGADLRALDDVIDTDADAKAKLEETVREVEKEEALKQIKPADEIEAAALEHMKKQEGIAPTIAPAVTPEVGLEAELAQLGEQRKALLTRERQGEDVADQIIQVDQRIAELRGEPSIVGRAEEVIVTQKGRVTPFGNELADVQAVIGGRKPIALVGTKFEGKIPEGIIEESFSVEVFTSEGIKTQKTYLYFPIGNEGISREVKGLINLPREEKFTVEYHTALGRLLGYSEADIQEFLKGKRLEGVIPETQQRLQAVDDEITNINTSIKANEADLAQLREAQAPAFEITSAEETIRNLKATLVETQRQKVQLEKQVARVVPEVAPEVTPEVAKPTPTEEIVTAIEKPTPKPEVAPTPEAVEVTPPEVIPEADVEVRRQLDELTKMHDIWRNKLVTSEQTKVSLAKFVRENLPLNVRGKFVTAVARVKTDAQLQTQLTKVQEVAEQNAQKVLKVEINKELKKAKAVVKDKILKGKFTPEVQRRLDVITRNLEIDRDAVRSKMADNITKSDAGEISHEEMLEANEALNFAGIDGMSSEELSSTLNYIKVLKTVGRSERQAKQEANTKRIVGIRTDISGILTGGQGLKTGVGAVPRKGLAAQPGWVDTFVNWQYSLDSLADKLSKLDPTSQPFQSEISKFVAMSHRATAKQAVSTTEQYQKVKRVIEKVYKVKGTRQVNHVLNGLDEEVDLGIFELTPEYKANHPGATTVNIKMSRDEMIAKWMQLQDTTLDNTFKTGMGWSLKVRDAIDTNLTAEEKALSEEIFTFYEDYYTDVNTIYQDLYNVDLPHNQKYSPIRRDLEGDIAENVLTFQDATQYASVINGSLKARIKNIKPLRFNGAIRVLSNHIDQMEHFKAWATTMRDFRRVFGNPEIRQAIEQYHGRGIVQLLDTFMNQMARGGIDTAATNRVADFLRKNFTKSILAIKPVVGLKQIPSLFAYISEMNVSEFFTGIADFWKAPIKNFRFLHKNSEGFRSRVSQGFERDIRAAQAKHGINKISGRGGFVDWFLLQIRLADTFAVTQGMWAKMRAGLKAGLTQQEAIAAAEDTTNRTQPSFSIDTLSALQNGGSWLKLMTMFQNQPNKYFRIVGDNLRNFKYDRGSRSKAASTILLTWVILPMMFQYIADAFQWKPERQARAAILGPLNYILIGGQLVQSIWGWLTDMPFDYQISPVTQTIRDLQMIVLKTKKLIKQGQDPYKDISVDDVAALLEYLAKAVGQVTGLPTPYFVQVEKQVRKKIAEDEDINIKDFLFSGWSLEPPKKGSEEKVEDLNLLLGETREGAEEKPLSEKPLPIYTTKEWFSDIGKVFKNVLPQDVLDDSNSSTESKAWAQYEVARSKADILPGISLYKINTEEGDDNITNYYQQWKARERLESLAELLEYDKLYPRANLGNVSRQQLNLLTKYLEAEDKDTFLEGHPLLRVNPRNEYLKANPTDNALLALGGQAKILSLEAFNEANRLIKELDIPEDAIPEFTLPPEGSVENYFKYQEQGDEFGFNSWEVQLIVAQDDELRTFLGREEIDTPVAALELKVKHRPLFEEHTALGDKDSTLYIEDDDARQEARDKLETDNPQWVDDKRRIEAIENDGTGTIIESWVERGKVVDEFNAGSSEAKVWLLDNPTSHKWALGKEILTDDGSDWNEPVLRLNTALRTLDDEYEAFGDSESPKYISGDDTRREAREKFLKAHPRYADDRRRRDMFSLDAPTELVEEFVAYGKVIDKFSAGSSQAKVFRADHPELSSFGESKDTLDWEPLELSKFPIWKIDEKFQKEDDEYDAILKKFEGKDETEATEAYLLKHPEYNRARRERDALKIEFPKEHTKTYINYYTDPKLQKPDDWPEGLAFYEDDWFLIENIEFYRAMLKAEVFTERRDFRNVPTREVFKDFLGYLDKFEGKPRKDFRWLLWIEGKRDLEKWLVDTKDFTPIVERVVGELELKKHTKTDILLAIQGQIDVKFFNILAPMTKEEILDNLPADIKIKAIAQLRKKLTPGERLAEKKAESERERQRLLEEAEKSLKELGGFNEQSDTIEEREARNLLHLEFEEEKIANLGVQPREQFNATIKALKSDEWVEVNRITGDIPTPQGVFRETGKEFEKGEIVTLINSLTGDVMRLGRSDKHQVVFTSVRRRRPESRFPGVFSV